MYFYIGDGASCHNASCHDVLLWHCFRIMWNVSLFSWCIHVDCRRTWRCRLCSLPVVLCLHLVIVLKLGLSSRLVAARWRARLESHRQHGFL